MWFNGILLGSVFSTFFLALFPFNWPWLAAYFLYVRWSDTHQTGGRKVAWMYNSSLFYHIRNYFRMKLVRVSELEPSKNYIFGYHPHGIIAFGAQGTFGGVNPEFQKLFPGIDVTALSVNFNFWFPVAREIGLGLGFASVSKRSIEHIIKPGNGRSVAIVVGGGAEALLSEERRVQLVLTKRLGFIRTAIETGADLVPVYGFGETSTFTISQTAKPYIEPFQNCFFKHFGVRFMLFFGRGFWDESSGPFPINKRITVVVGEPVQVIQNSNPTDEEIAKIHYQYVTNLKHLYNKYKDDYHVGGGPAPELEIL